MIYLSAPFTLTWIHFSILSSSLVTYTHQFLHLAVMIFTSEWASIAVPDLYKLISIFLGEGTDYFMAPCWQPYLQSPPRQLFFFYQMPRIIIVLTWASFGFILHFRSSMLSFCTLLASSTQPFSLACFFPQPQVNELLYFLTLRLELNSCLRLKPLFPSPDLQFRYLLESLHTKTFFQSRYTEIIPYYLSVVIVYCVQHSIFHGIVVALQNTTAMQRSQSLYSQTGYIQWLLQLAEGYESPIREGFKNQTTQGNRWDEHIFTEVALLVDLLFHAIVGPLDNEGQAP